MMRGFRTSDTERVLAGLVTGLLVGGAFAFVAFTVAAPMSPRYAVGPALGPDILQPTPFASPYPHRHRFGGSLPGNRSSLRDIRDTS
jgi:hypothetical protein